MVTFDRRDQFEDSDANLDTVAAEAHRLHESEAFREDVLDALGPVFKQHLDCEAVDAEAEEVLRRWVRKDGMGGLFQIRNQIVSNQHADLEEGDIIYVPANGFAKVGLALQQLLLPIQPFSQTVQSPANIYDTFQSRPYNNTTSQGGNGL